MGKFHRGLANDDKLTNALLAVKTQASNKGLLTGAQSLAELYQLPSSFIYNPENKTVHLVVHVPLYRESHVLTLYRFIPSPVPLPWDKNLFFEINPDKNYLAQNRDGTLTRTLSPLELQDCLSMGLTYFCDDNALEKKNYLSCLNSLFNGISDLAIHTCDAHLTSAAISIIRLNRTTYLMAEPKPLRVTTECTLRGQTAAETLDVPAGAHFLTVNPECTTTSEHWVISPSNTLEDVFISSVQLPTHLDPTAFFSDINTDHLQLIMDSLRTVGRPIPIGQVRGLATFSNAMQRKNQEYFWAKTLLVPFTSTFFLIGLCIVFFIIYRKCSSRPQPQPIQSIQLQPLLQHEVPHDANIDRIANARLEPSGHQPASRPSSPSNIFRFGQIS